MWILLENVIWRHYLMMTGLMFRSQEALNMKIQKLAKRCFSLSGATLINICQFQKWENLEGKFQSSSTIIHILFNFDNLSTIHRLDTSLGGNFCVLCCFSWPQNFILACGLTSGRKMHHRNILTRFANLLNVYVSQLLNFLNKIFTYYILVCCCCCYYCSFCYKVCEFASYLQNKIGIYLLFWEYTLYSC